MHKIIFPIVQKHGVYKIFLLACRLQYSLISPHMSSSRRQGCQVLEREGSVSQHEIFNFSPHFAMCRSSIGWHHLNPMWKQQKSNSHLLCSLVNDVLLGRENLSSVNPSAMIFWFGSAGHCPSSKAGRANMEQSSEIVVLQKKHRWLLRRCREIQRWQDWCLQGKKKVSISQA